MYVCWVQGGVSKQARCADDGHRYIWTEERELLIKDSLNYYVILNNYIPV